jgi:hypothetical protein
MQGRYFVTVQAPTGRAMIKLAEFELDLFQATARETADGGAIEGLLTLEEIGRVVDAGYQVTVEEPDSARSRSHETATFDEWLEGMSE